MNITFFKTFRTTKFDDFNADVKFELLEIGKKYLNYVAWEKPLILCDDFTDEVKLMTFQEILIEEFNGNMDAAINECLISDIYNTQLHDIIQWSKHTGTFIHYATIEMFLCAIKNFVMEITHTDYDELKYLLGLEISLK
jgi:hypothetical protein